MRTLHRSLAAAGLALALVIPAFAQDVQERVIRFGHLNNADHPVSFGVKRFAELLAAKSGGRMKVQEFPASQLGNEMQQQSALQGGVQQMSAPATTSLAGIVKEFGLVDFPFSVILSNKFFEVQKFLSATNHVYAANIVLVSKKFWDGLSPAEQKMMNDAANETRAYQRQVSRAAAQRAVAELQAKGIQYNQLAPAELKRMRDIARPVVERFAASYDPATVKLYNDELARVHKANP